MKSKTLIASKKLILTVVLFFLSSLIIGGDQNGSVRQLDETEMSSYAADTDFNYMNMRIEPPSIWQRLKWWFGALIASIFDNPNTPWLANSLFYVILVLVLGLAIYYIVRLRYGGGLSPDSKYFTSHGARIVDGAEKLDYDSLINTALDEKQYKLAIRYLYLKTLTFLHAKDVIAFREWKSPYDYEKELDKSIVPAYRSLTGLFEHAWYGEFNVGNDEYSEGKKLAITIEEELK